MAYTKIYNGSRGDEVKRLQESLNGKGYSLDVDGVFGAQTEKAVRDYQTKNKLAVDGVVGDETWGHLSQAAEPKKANVTTAAVPTEAKTPAKEPAVDWSQYTYDPTADEGYLRELGKLQTLREEKPEVGGSRYDAELDALYQKIMNREKFSYDVNADALYQQYRDQYMMGGQQAMRDTMGQAAALTGGYGSTYSQNAGQQAYNAYLQQLNEVVPELYGAAAEQYAREGEVLYDQYAMIGAARDDEYQRQQDALTRYWQEVEAQQATVDQLYAQGADNFYNAQQLQQWREQMDYQKARDAEELQYQRERDAIEDERYEREWAAAQEAVRSYSGGDGGSYSGGSSGDDDVNGGKMPTTPEEKTRFSAEPMLDQDFYRIEMKIEELAKTEGADAAIDYLAQNAEWMTEDQYNELEKVLLALYQ